MAGIAQVWLTAEELEALALALDLADEATLAPPSRAEKSARVKIERALAPVACDTASGSKTP